MSRANTTQVGGNILWVRIIVALVALLGAFLLGQYSADQSADLQAMIKEQSEQIEHIKSTTVNKDRQIEACRSRLASLGGTASTDYLAPPSSPAMRTYVVQNGDTLTSIAQSMYGSGNYHQLIADANGISQQRPLTIGQVLQIPNNPDKDSPPNNANSPSSSND